MLNYTSTTRKIDLTLSSVFPIFFDHEAYLSDYFEKAVTQGSLRNHNVGES